MPISAIYSGMGPLFQPCSDNPTRGWGVFGVVRFCRSTWRRILYAFSLRFPGECAIGSPEFAPGGRWDETLGSGFVSHASRHARPCPDVDRAGPVGRDTGLQHRNRGHPPRVGVGRIHARPPHPGPSRRQDHGAAGERHQGRGDDPGAGPPGDRREARELHPRAQRHGQCRGDQQLSGVCSRRGQSPGADQPLPADAAAPGHRRRGRADAVFQEGNHDPPRGGRGRTQDASGLQETGGGGCLAGQSLT